MTGKKKIGKESLFEELTQLFEKVETLQKRTARSGVPTGVWSSVLGIQNTVQDALDTVEDWEES